MNAIINIFNVYGLILLKGTIITLSLWILCSTISFILGFIIGILRSNNIKIIVLSNALNIITFILQAIPLYVQVLIVYFVIPDYLPFNVSPWWAGVCALGICSSAYTSEIILNGINNIPVGQWEASFVLGYSKWQQLYYIILPQVLRNTMPVILNEFNMILKSTSILSSIGVLELTKTAMNIAVRSLNPFPIYIAISIIYIGITSLFLLIIKRVQARFGL